LALRAFTDLSSLDPVERHRFDLFFYFFIASFERALLAARDREYPEELLVPLNAGIAGFLRTEGGRAWWKERKILFSAFGQQSIDGIINDPTIDDRGAGPFAPTS
jgi:hypothetical protein